jgi:hypothetical protein
MNQLRAPPPATECAPIAELPVLLPNMNHKLVTHPTTEYAPRVQSAVQLNIKYQHAPPVKTEFAQRALPVTHPKYKQHRAPPRATEYALLATRNVPAVAVTRERECVIRAAKATIS